jgi:hypothetical protein
LWKENPENYNELTDESLDRGHIINRNWYALSLRSKHHHHKNDT